MKGAKNMKMYVTSKKALNDLIKDLRSIGYMLITYGDKLAELEKNGNIIVIERR